jgi:hypothetical protein
MPEIDDFFDEIDGNRSRRARELSEIKRRFMRGGGDPYGIGSKAVVVLAYAHWEGFYNDCVKSYIDFLSANGGRMRDTDWMMLVGALSNQFRSLYDRRHSHEARCRFIEEFRRIIDCGYEDFDGEVVQARSNLNYSRLQENYAVLNFDIQRLQRYRLRIDHQIVSWRHQIAHGDQPDLSDLDIGKHIDLVAELLLVIADQFQEAMLTRLN